MEYNLFFPPELVPLMPQDDLNFPPEMIGDFTDQYWCNLFNDDPTSTTPDQLLADANSDEGTFKIPEFSDLPPTTQIISDEERFQDSCLSDDVEELECEIRNALEGMLGTIREITSMPGFHNQQVALPAKSEFIPPAAQVSKKKRQRERWTTEEHMQFLEGIRLFGDGNWKTISQQCVPTRSHIQIASHAQKYYLRKHSSGKKRKSIHDITTADPNLQSYFIY